MNGALLALRNFHEICIATQTFVGESVCVLWLQNPDVLIVLNLDLGD